MTVDTSCDNHVHTSFCRHASGTMEEYVQAAIGKGLRRLVFLEHLEEGISYSHRTWLHEEDFDAYFAEGLRLKRLYAGRIDIGLGVEAGYNPDCVADIRKRLESRPWDCIGLSYHFARVPGHPGHLNLLSSKKTNLERLRRANAAALLSHYFDTLVEAVRTIPAHILCHLDAGLRHVPDLQLEQDHHRRIDTLLREMKQAGMALEINTSGYPLRHSPFPPLRIIAKAADMGIHFTAGSDAHRPDEVGRYFERLPDLFRRGTPPSPP